MTFLQDSENPGNIGNIGPQAVFWVYKESEFKLINVRNDGRVFLFDSSMATVIGGQPGIGRLQAYDRSSIVVQPGGRVQSIEAHDSSTVTIQQGTITGGLTSEGGTINVTGSTGHSVFAVFRGKISISESSLDGGVSAATGGMVFLTDTNVGSLHINDSNLESGFISMSGGEVESDVTAAATSGAGVGHISLDRVTVFGGINVIGPAASSSGASMTVAASNSRVSGDVTVSGRGDYTMISGSIRGNVALGDGSTSLLQDSHVEGSVTLGSVALLGGSHLNCVQCGVSGDVRALGDSIIDVTGGGFDGNIVLFQNSTFNLSGGARASSVSLAGNAHFNMLGNAGILQGVVGAIDGRPVMNLLGGTVDGTVFAGAASQATLGGSLVTGDVIASSVGTVNILDGTVNGNLGGFGSSTIFMSGGHVKGFPVIKDDSSFFWSGGTIDFGGTGANAGLGQQLARGQGGVGCDPLLDEDCELEPPQIGLSALDNAKIQIIGHNLQSTLVDPNFEGFYSLYQLTGQLADGTNVGGTFVVVQNQTSAAFELVEAVPEPASMLLLVQVALVSAVFRRCQRPQLI